MIRADLRGAFLAVISAGRPGNAPATFDLIGPATWYVGAGEAPAYRAAGAPRVVESGGLCASRNRALDHAAASRAACIQVSDDLRGLQIAEVDPGRPGKNIARDAPFSEIAERLLGGLNPGPGPALAGVAPTANLIYARPGAPPSPRRCFVVGDLFAVAPGCPLRFDARMRLKEDYDYTLQHLARYGSVARHDDVLAGFRHRSNPGGAVAVRTAALEQRMIALLERKWPGSIRRRADKPDEIFLRWPPRRGAVSPEGSFPP